VQQPLSGTSRGPDTWQPQRYLEPNHPDNEEVFEQAAYQAAVTRLGGDNRQGPRKYKPRKTVDFMGPVVKWRQVSVSRDTRRGTDHVDE
jgi:polyadenylation factor subunit 2